MVFHRPFLNLAVNAFPESDILLGKPLPVQAVDTFYRVKDASRPSSGTPRIQWLIDSAQRLDQYHAFARRMGLKMLINIEIDVGLHRGGIPRPEELAPLLKTIAEDPVHLDLSGFMGYDPHVAKSGKLLIPRVSGPRPGYLALQKVREIPGGGIPGPVQPAADLQRRRQPDLFHVPEKRDSE
jgi:D-serine deaminase-like pyridoxal phosphate-dependent protein